MTSDLFSSSHKAAKVDFNVARTTVVVRKCRGEVPRGSAESSLLSHITIRRPAKASSGYQETDPFQADITLGYASLGWVLVG